MRIFVAGGTGVVGRPLVETLVDRGHEVTASTHRTENFSVIEALGARPALMDRLDDGGCHVGLTFQPRSSLRSACGRLEA